MQIRDNLSAAEDETERLPMSVLAFWREPANPELETLQAQLNLPDNLDDDDETLPGPPAGR